MEFKREAIKYAEKNSNHKAAEKFHVAVKRIRESKTKEQKNGRWEKTTRLIIRIPINLMNLWQQIQWTACLENTYAS